MAAIEVKDDPNAKLTEEPTLNPEENETLVESEKQKGSKRDNNEVTKNETASSKKQKFEDNNDSDGDGDEDKGSGKFQKRMMAIQFGYVGTGYAGLQKNPGQKTIEEELEKALHSAGAIATCNFGDLKKVKWSRAARTDKGVHALGNVVAAKLLLPKPANEDAGGDAGGGGGGKGKGKGKGGGEDSVPLSQDREVIARLIADTNAHLPPAVRVLDLKRTTKTFNAKISAAGRRYE